MGLKVGPRSPSYNGHHFPAEIIAHAVWLYFRFPLSYRQVAEIRAARAIGVSYEAIRKWSRKFGPTYAAGLHRRRPQPGAKWHLHEGFLKIHGQQHYLWRAVDQQGTVRDMLIPARRDRQAAKRFFRKVLQRCRYVPRVMITAKLASYDAAQRAILPGVEHRQHKGLNNRAANAQQPTRHQERQMRRFKSAGHAQRLLSALEPIAGHCRRRRHRVPAAAYRAARRCRFGSWRQVTGTQVAA